MLPANLLEHTCEATVDYFRSFAIAHPRLVEAKDRLLAAIRESERNTLILVLGATGVGKTTLRLGIERIPVKDALKELAADPGKAPAVAVEAVAPESGNFNWTFFSSYCWRRWRSHLPIESWKVQRTMFAGTNCGADPPGRETAHPIIAMPSNKFFTPAGPRPC
jgi:hypothetical protein